MPIDSGGGRPFNTSHASVGIEKYGHHANTNPGVMSSEEKRRKVQRACDICRRKKIKCDGPMNSNSTSKCAHCADNGWECTYVEAAKRRGPAKGYMETLEQRCERLEKVLQQLHPGVDFTSTVGPMPSRDEFDLPSYQETLKNLGIPQFPQLKAPAIANATSSTAQSSAPSPSALVLGASPWKKFERDSSRPLEDDEHEDEQAHAAIADALHKLEVQDHGWRFHGKASGARLLHVITDLKYNKPDHPTFLDALFRGRREEYWKVPEWEIVIAQDDVRPIDWSVWPTTPLDQELIESYFSNVNFHLPLLNQVIFQRQYHSGLYRTNTEFAKICLMIFANGARFIDRDEVYWPVDQATTPEGQDRLRRDLDGTRKYSAGWRYLRAVMKMGKSIMQPPGLYEFQSSVLICAFLQGSAVPHLMWVVSGYGLRSAQELGIHVKSTLAHIDPIERALCNRAFWCLYHIDRINCAAIGRSVALQDSDFDAEYPIAVDDEYWDTGFQQPPGKLPQITSFIHLLKLDHVIGAALRTIYALSHERVDRTAQRSVVVELDSALNSWADDVPDSLRWDPTRADERLFIQSAILYSHYYYCQILIHRPFIPSRKQTDTIGLPSLAICSNASRSISNILDAVLRRSRQSGRTPGQAFDVSLMLPAMIAAIILLIAIYKGDQSAQERERCMGDVKKCLAASRDMEMTWRQAGKITDFLTELSREGDLPPEPIRGEKRVREELNTMPSNGNTQSGSGSFLSEPMWNTYIPPDFEQTFMEQTLFGGPANTFDPNLPGDESDLWTQLFGSFTQGSF